MGQKWLCGCALVLEFLSYTPALVVYMAIARMFLFSSLKQPYYLRVCMLLPSYIMSRLHPFMPNTSTSKPLVFASFLSMGKI